CLIILVPLLSIPLKTSGHLSSIYYFMGKLTKNSRMLFSGISFLVFCLAPILNLGSIRLIHESIDKLQIPQKILGKAYFIRFSAVILWSPYFASVALVLYYLDVQISKYIFWGLLLSFIQLLVGNILFWKQNYTLKASNMSNPNYSPQKEIYHKRKIYQILLFIISLLAIVFILESVTKWAMIFLVSLISILSPFIGIIFTQKKTKYIYHLKEYFYFSIPNTNNEVVL